MRKTNAISRRRFIIATTAGAIGAVLAAASLWPVWEFLSPKGKGEEQETASIPRSNVGLGKAHFFHFRGHPSVVLQHSPGKFIALSAVCTHLGCIVEWRPKQDIFFCPCHAGIFSWNGKVLGGPPPRPLPAYPVKVLKDRLVIG